MVKRKSDDSEEIQSKKTKETNSVAKVKSLKKFSKKDKPPLKKSNNGHNKTNTQNAKFNQFGKGKLQEKHDDPTEKPDWNEFKKQKKDLRIKRKQSKSLFEIVAKAKQIGEILRMKTIEGGKEKRDKLVNELHGYCQENYVKFVLSHDMARIVQYMLKFGDQKIREEIASEITPSTKQMLQSKYGRYCIKRLFKYGNAKTRSNAIKAMYGNIVKLTSHTVSAHVFEYIYSTWAQPLEKVHMIQEFFGDLYKQAKDTNIKHLKDVYKESPDMKTAALGAVKANLSRVLNKDLLDSGLIQSVLYQYLTECSENERNDLISQLAPHAVVLSNSKDGSRAVMELIWHGTNKDKKVIMKAIKEHTLELSKHEHGHTVIIALLHCIDDTVLVNKMIISEIINNALDIVKDEWGRKVILWLVTPGDSLHFHPTFTNELDCGREKSSSKKSLDVRRQEILAHSTDTLLTNITTNTKIWFENASLSVVALAILKTGNGTPLSEALSNVAQLIVDNEWKVKINEEEFLGIEHAGLHMTFKKLIQNDKDATEDKPTFCEALLQHLADDVIELWLTMNRSCFLLVAVLENGNNNAVNTLQQKLQQHKKLIKKSKTTGSKILYKKLKSSE